MAETSCLFCRVVAGEIPATRIFEDDRCVAFRDIDPQAPTHILIVPREHFASLDDAGAEREAIMGHALHLASVIASQEGLAGGYRTVINTGPDANQSVQHLHLHILGGRTMGWPPG